MPVLFGLILGVVLTVVALTLRHHEREGFECLVAFLR
jgi:hypothetical protein